MWHHVTSSDITNSVKLQLSVASITVCSEEKCLVVMESNTTMFDGSEETIYNVTYPLYAIYLHEVVWVTTDNHPCGYLIFICHLGHTKEQGVEEY